MSGDYHDREADDLYGGREKVERAVTSLPGTPGGIADLCRARGVKGRRGAARSCPLARLLTLLTGRRVFAAGRLYDQGPADQIGEEAAARFSTRNAVALTPAAYLFMSDFDAGRHPELEER